MITIKLTMMCHSITKTRLRGPDFQEPSRALKDPRLTGLKPTLNMVARDTTFPGTSQAMGEGLHQGLLQVLGSPSLTSGPVTVQRTSTLIRRMPRPAIKPGSNSHPVLDKKLGLRLASISIRKAWQEAKLVRKEGTLAQIKVRSQGQMILELRDPLVSRLTQVMGPASQSILGTLIEISIIQITLMT